MAKTSPKNFHPMGANIFDKILRIIQVVVILLQMAVKSFTGLRDEDLDSADD